MIRRRIGRRYPQIQIPRSHPSSPEMNGSFESPSHLERRIRAGLEDADDSSLSAPGWARGRNSQSLSFQTDEEAQTRTSDRILDELTELQTNGKTPTSYTARSYGTNTQTFTALRNRPGSQPTLATAISRSSQDSNAQPQPTNAALPSSAASALDDPSSFDDFSRSQAKPEPSSSRALDPLASVSDADFSEEREERENNSLPMTSTPHRSNATRTRSNFGNSRNERSLSGRQTLAKRATESAARDVTRGHNSTNAEPSGSRSDSNRWSLQGRRSHPSRRDVSADTIPQSNDREDSQLSQDIPHTQNGDSAMPSSSSRDLATNSPRTRTGTSPSSLKAYQAARAADQVTSEKSADLSGGGQPNGSTASSARSLPHEAGMATPKPRIDRDRMLSYVLSTMKDPVREQRILHSVRAPRFRAQRVPIDQIESEESTDQQQPDTPADRNAGAGAHFTPLPAIGSRLGRPMTAMAGRTPLPMKPSRLANQIYADDASQASAESSTYDLMTPAKGWANTSEPGFGVAEGNAARVGNRVDPRKLSKQVHKMNENLEEENALLREEANAAEVQMEALRRQLNTALREKEHLSKQLETRNATATSPSQVALPPSPAGVPADRLASRDPDRTAIPTSYEDALDRVDLLESHREELNGLLDNLEDKYELLQQEHEELRQHKETRPSETENNDATESSTGQLQADLEQALRELDDLEYRLQESEDERARLQAAVEEAKEFALQEAQKAEQARDDALGLADQHRKTADKLQRQVDELQTALGRHKDDQSLLSQPRVVSETHNQDDIADIQEENERLRAQLGMARDDMDQADAEHQRVREELEEALETVEGDLQTLEAERAQLDEQLQTAVQQADDLRDEVDRHKITLSEKENELLKLTRHSSNDRVIQERIEALTRSLESAEREQQTLQKKLTDSVPLAQMNRELQLKDAELDALSRSKETVEKRLQEYKDQMRQQQQANTSVGAAHGASPAGQTTLKTPAKGVHKQLLNLRTPLRTPRSPGILSPASWMNETTIGNMDENIRNVIHNLQSQLDEANEQIDERLAQIDELGLGHLGLVKSLKEASDRIESLEAELDRIVGAGGDVSVIAKRLKAVRCLCCGERFDATQQVKVSSHGVDLIASDFGGADAAKKRSLAKSARGVQRDRDLAIFVEKVPLLQTRLKAMEEENKRLREARPDGSAQDDRHVKEMARDLQKATHEEIQRARAVIDDMDAELREERRRLPELARDSKLFGDLTSSAERELARTEVRLRAIDTELRHKIADYEQYQQELMDKSSAGQLSNHLQVLEAQIRHTGQELDHLRQDKNTVLQVRAELHSKFLAASERYNAVEDDLRTTREAVSAHERQIHSQTNKIQELHTALKSHRDEIRQLAGDRDRLTAQREMIIEDVSRLEVDLRRVRGESATFGRDLEKLRRDRDEQRRQAEVARESSVSITAEAQETIGLLRVQLNHAREMIRGLEVNQKAAQEDGISEAQVAALQEKHVAECKGLLVQIRYLKTVFMRESDLRSDLVLQKQYLLQVCGGLEMNEQETVRFLSDLDRSRGQPGQAKTTPLSPRTRLRKVFFTVLAVSKARCMAQRWGETKRVKSALQAAHEEARARRLQREQEAQGGIGEETITPQNVDKVQQATGMLKFGEHVYRQEL